MMHIFEEVGVYSALHGKKKDSFEFPFQTDEPVKTCQKINIAHFDDADSTTSLLAIYKLPRDLSANQKAKYIL